MARTEWLSEGAEKLALRLPDADGFHCDIAIVGSGYGGAVAAARLAGRQEEDGRASRVWVLERGHEFVPGAFPERFADLVGQARVTWGEQPQVSGLPEGLFDLKLGADVSALVGNGLGGGSLINAGVLARPLECVFREPWPRELSARALAPHFDAAERMLGAAKLPGPAPAKLRALESLATSIDGEQVDRRVPIAVSFSDGRSRADVQQRACIACGDCFTGCNHGAKNTLPMNYLALARRRGAKLFTGVTVLSLDGVDNNWWLDLRFTDRQVARRYGTVPPRLHAKRVILAAGAYGSTGILMRSRDRGFGALSADQLGRRFSTNGDMIAAGYRMPAPIGASAKEGTPPWDRHIGPTIAGMIDLRNRRVPLAVEELAIPAALRRSFEEVVTTLGVLHGLPRADYSQHRATGTGADAAAIDPELIGRTAVYATMGDDGAAGELTLRQRALADEHLRLDDDVCVEWEGVAECEVFREAIRVLEEAHAGTGALLMPNPMWRALPRAIGSVLDEGQIGGSVFTVHPLGGCAMAESGAQGVVNRFGQVFANRNDEQVHATLAVLDGAIVPTALEINPCLTIAALAEYAVGELAGIWRMRLAPRHLAPLADPPRPAPLPWPDSEPTRIRLAERLDGDVQIALDIGGEARLRGFKAHLELEYREIPSLEDFLSAHNKSMPIAKGRLHLHAPPQPGAAGIEAVDWHGTVDLEGELRAFEREASSPRARIVRAGLAWLRNRGAREIWSWLRSFAWLGRGRRRGGGLGLREILAVASHAGEARLLSYDLVVRRDVALVPGGPCLLSAGDRLLGLKRIAYVPALPWAHKLWPSPWDQFTRLPLELHRRSGRPGFAMGTLLVDLPYFVKQFATQLQVTAQENQPRAIADLYSFFAYLVRLIGKIHIWSFRAPDYPNPYPEYEFDEEGRRAAEVAAQEANVTLESRLDQRLPGDVQGLQRTLARNFFVSPPPARIRLTRYAQAGTGGGAALRPVLLIHGLGASGNTFTLPTIKECLVKHLADRGFDAWVLDLRTSVGLRSSKRDWSFEEAAFGDIPKAIDVIRRSTGAEKIDVVAHCIGAAMFSMAALEGRLKDAKTGRDMVRKAVLSQAGPLMELPPANRFRGYLASYLKHYLQIDEFDTTASLTRFNRFVDRVLAAYPYPRDEWAEHLSLFPVRHEAYCLRTYGIYGRLFEHAHLNRETLDRLGDTIGHVRYKTYQQTIFYATMRRLTDAYGKNVYVTPERIEANLAFPLCFVHGAENQVFDARTSRRSFDLLASVFWWPDLKEVWKKKPADRYDYSAYSQGKQLRIVEVPGYGHQDCMIGWRAYLDVYPRIVDFLNAEVDPNERPENQRKSFIVRPARLGPVLGWLRPGRAGRYALRLILVPNDSRSRALYALTFLVRGGAPVPGTGKFHYLRRAREKGPPVKMLDVDLPDHADASLVVLTVHYELYESELARDSGEPALDDPFGEDIDYVLGPNAGLPEAPAQAVALSGAAIDALEGGRFLPGVFEACRDVGIDGTPLGSGRRVSDQRYASPVSAAILDHRVLRAADSRQEDGSVCFALASCRYASNVTDRELADRKFGQLRDLLEKRDTNRGAPQFLFLAGDTIYADATYGIFDPTLGEERYDQRYFEAWTAPNAQEVLRRLPVYPMLDDHEVEENFEGLPTRDPGKAGMRAYEAFQVLLTPRAGIGARKNYWYALSAAGFDFFVADTRTGRRRGRGPASLDATVGDEVMIDLRLWLIEARRRGPDKPKFIVSPSVVAPWSKQTRGHRAYALRSDAWDAFPDSLHQLLGFIAAEGIRNVVFLSGDYHCSVFSCLSLKCGGAAPVTAYSIVSSGLYSPYPFANTRVEDLELCFQGTHRDWLGRGDAPCCDRLGELEIGYVAKPMAAGASFAVVGVERRGPESWMTVGFDEGTAPVEVRLS